MVDAAAAVFWGDDTMLHIKNLNEGLEIFKTLGSDVRMRIVELLSEQGEMNMNEIAAALELTNGALTAHIRRLEECGIITTVTEYTGHGNQKLCSIKTDQILLDGRTEEPREIKVYNTEVRIGHFSDYEVSPPCGLCSVYRQIGEENDPRFFDHTERLEAGLLWFSKGYVEYRIPKRIPERQRITQVTFFFEISSDQAGESESCQSDIVFLLNGKKIGSWLTPPEFRWDKGIYTPRWWSLKERRSGLQTMIVVTRYGTYLDGLKISDVTLNDVDIDGQEDMRLRFCSGEKRGHNGGIVLYGSGFGNYNQDIHVRVHYTNES